MSEEELSPPVKTLLEQVIFSNFVDLNPADYTLTITRGTKKGDNYIGVIYRAEIHPQGHTFLVKVANPNEAERAFFQVRNCFLHEIHVYTDFLSLYQDIQTTIEDESDRFHQVPTVFGTLELDHNEALIMNDLRAEGFYMFDRLRELSVERVEMALRCLAKFHAVSYAVKEKFPERMKRIQANKELFLRHESDVMWRGICEEMTKKALDLLDREEDKEIIGPVSDVLGTSFISAYEKLLTKAAEEPHATVCHGDFWINNVMFKDDEKGQPIDIRMLDFQLARYSSPVTDISYFLFCCTTEEFREKYMERVLGTYYETFSGFLSRLNLDPSITYSRETFQDDFKKFGIFGFFMAIMLLPIFIAKPEEIHEVDEITKHDEADTNKVTIVSDATERKTKERMRGVIYDIVKHGCLDGFKLY